MSREMHNGRESLRRSKQSPFALEYSPISDEDTPEKNKERLHAFKNDIGTQIPDGVVDAVFDASYCSYLEYIYEIGETDPEILQATGEAHIATQYDALQGEPEWLDPEIVARALTDAHFDLGMSLHPARLVSLRRAELRGFTPTPGKTCPAVERFEDEHSAVHSSAFAFRVISTHAAIEEGLSPVNSANDYYCDGLWVPTTNNGTMVTGAIMSNSTQDSQSAHSHAMLALGQSRSFVTCDSIWNDPRNQMYAYRRAMQLIDTNPTVNAHPERDFIVQRAKSLVGITMKASIRDAHKRLNAFYAQYPSQPVTVRIYEPRGRTNEVEQTIRWLKKNTNDVTIIAGNVTDVVEAKIFEHAGANALTYILGGGGICETPLVARIAVENIIQTRKLANAGLRIPIIADSSTGDTYAILAAMGASGFMKGQNITSGIEKPPYCRWYHLPDGSMASNYSGEAGKRSKKLGGKLDYRGRPIYVEGADTYVQFNEVYQSIPSRLWGINQALSTAGLFSRHPTIDDLRRTPQPNIVYVTESAEYAGTVHHGR